MIFYLCFLESGDLFLLSLSHGLPDGFKPS